MLHLKHLTKEFAGKPLFTDISWHLKKGERVGLVGDNGAGKSTLMRIIAGQVEPSGGELQFAKGATVGYLPQDGIVTRGQPLFQEVLGALEELQALEEELHRLTTDLAAIRYRVRQLHQPAVQQQPGAISQPPRLKDIVRHQHHRRPSLAVDLSHYFLDQPPATFDPATGRADGARIFTLSF